MEISKDRVKMDRHDIEDLRNRIIAQADASGDSGWLTIPVAKSVSSNRLLRVPRGAFEQWAVNLSNGGHLATAWTPLSPIGLKQGADCSYHTDWLLGAGFDPLDMHPVRGKQFKTELSEAAYSARSEIERRLLHFETSVLLPGPELEGIVAEASSPGKVVWDVMLEIGDYKPPILILKNAGSEWLPDVLECFGRGGGVIVENGGGLAHLVVEARSLGVGPIFRQEKAKKIYPEGAILRLHPAFGSIDLIEQAVPARISQVDPWEDQKPLQEIQEEAIAANERNNATGIFRSYAENDYGFRDVTEFFEYKLLNRMEPVYQFPGRDWLAYASMQWQDRGYSTDDQSAYLVVHVSQKNTKNRITLISSLRHWKYGEISHATKQALLLIAPAEAYDSPESKTIRERYELQMNTWWLHQISGRKSDEDPIASAGTILFKEAGLTDAEIYPGSAT